MPNPITSLSVLVPKAPAAETILPIIAATLSTAAMPKTLGLAILAKSVLIPMFKKKIGMNTWLIDATSRSTRSCAPIRRSEKPATKAPMIGARFDMSANTLNARAVPIASTETVADDLLSAVMRLKTAGKIAKPTVLDTTRKTTARAIVVAIVPTPTLPCSTIRVTTVRMTSPSTSSATAAPSTMRASTVASARKSPNTRAVIPIDVAVSAAPKKSDVLVLLSNSTPVPKPSAIGAATPSTATNMDTRPTLLSSPMSVSRPTWISKKITPNSASTCSVSLTPTSDSTEGPMRIPAAISPITAGIPMRSDNSEANLATTKMMAISSKTRPMSTVPPALPNMTLSTRQP